ncbi:MAG: FG-GAP-like repeat-containing protein [bacterium]|nr:FG-GAP-like repeat-containing protein [bacterium]
MSRRAYLKVFTCLVLLSCYILLPCLPIVFAADVLKQPGLFQPHPHRSALLQHHLQAGMQAAREGRLQEAIGHLKYCVALDASFVDAYYLLGLVYYHLGLSHVHETDYAMSKVLDIQPKHLEARIYRGLTRMRLGTFAGAEEDFKTVLTHVPNMVLVRKDLAAAYLRQGNMKDAIATYKRVIDEKPNHLVARWNLRVAYAQIGGYPDDLSERYRILIPELDNVASPITFKDVGHTLGVSAMTRGRGSAWGDYDRDGDADLFTVGIKDPHHLYRNNGDGTFTDVTQISNLNDARGGWASLFFDYDRDGDIDLFVTRDGWRGVEGNSLYRNNGDGTFTDVAAQAGVEGASDSFTASLADINNDGWLDIYVANGVSQAGGAANNLYLNLGNGTFSDVALQAGVANHGRSIGSAFGDYNNDGWPDLMVINHGGPNALYRNQGDGTFVEVTSEAGLEAPLDGFVSFFFDYDNDGWLDLFVTGWTEDMEAILKSALERKPSDERNRLALYHNNGDGTFTDVTAQSGLAQTYGAMAAQFADIDNDGFLDIYLGTGGPPMDTYEPNKLFWNTGNGAFLDVTNSAGVGNLGKGHGATFADYDDDGDIDLYVPMGGAMFGDRQPNSLYQNNGTPHHWLKLRLVASKSNPDAIGAKIIATIERNKIYRTVNGGTGFGSMNDPVVMLGLGGATRLSKLRVEWPSGIRQEFFDIKADQLLVITEGQPRMRPSRP